MIGAAKDYECDCLLINKKPEDNAHQARNCTKNVELPDLPNTFFISKRCDNNYNWNKTENKSHVCSNTNVLLYFDAERNKSEKTPQPPRNTIWRSFAAAARPFFSHPVHLTAATALFCAMSAAILLWRHQAVPPAPADLGAMARTWLERSTNPIAVLGTIELPLEKEMNYVLSDAKSALLAVADGVLPSGILGSARGPGEE